MVTKKPGNQTIHKISLPIVVQNVYINRDFHNLRVGVVFQNLQPTPSSEQHINFYNFSLVLGSKRERKADQEKLHIDRIGAGERRSSGARKDCFQYLIPVYQLLINPMIGKL